MIDVDHFKRYNDDHGHQGGDRLLRKIARILAMMPSRPTDLVARYGGEEFAVVLPDTSSSGAIALAKKMLERVCEDCQVTISIGVATLQPLPNVAPEILIEVADRFLYQAKSQGRNRVVSSLKSEVFA